MKKYFYLMVLSVLPLAGKAQNTVQAAESPHKKYNRQLADSLGADERGMKNYMLVILKTGPKDSVITDKKEREELFKGHFSNMTAMEKAGKLKLAGPFATKNNLGYRGIFLLDVATEAEARSLLQNDPTVKAGIFSVEILPFYGSAAIPMHLKYHHQISQDAL
ncbi:YciI family protein [Kaistella sp. 97-N-M2]|uniref:YciI family protein n=1 Tax=Kaistella sp. 97-N-M2 TaxID=2908645 RepID=UPI001F3273EA|nr:YciI family protein [Kaistella sp. 97-N-M2]UJF30529.1 YciI family protein [Kaistella sp. 97-N-M2]